MVKKDWFCFAFFLFFFKEQLPFEKQCKKQNSPYSFIPLCCQEVGTIIVKNCADQGNTGMQSN